MSKCFVSLSLSFQTAAAALTATLHSNLTKYDRLYIKILGRIDYQILHVNQIFLGIFYALFIFTASVLRFYIAYNTNTD